MKTLDIIDEDAAKKQIADVKLVASSVFDSQL